MSGVIFHHYPPSPVAEKVRAAFGLKKLAWRSVEHDRLPNRDVCSRGAYNLLVACVYAAV